MPLFGTRGAASVTGFGGLAKLGYLLRNSLRFRSSASAYLSRTGTTASNVKTATYSFWMKRGILSTGTQWIFTGGGSGAVSLVGFNAGADTLSVFNSDSSAEGNITTAVFRDPAAWYHIVIRINTTEGTASDRAKIYVNGVQQAVSTNAGGIGLDATWNFNTAQTLNIGRYTGASGYSDLYLAEIHFIDGGTPPLPSAFAKTDPATGQWIPIKYAGTYGNNGFYLNFTDASAATAAAIGKDSSGNGNNWTPNNISVTAGATYDSMTDVPTLTNTTAANYAVISPINGVGTALSITGANLNFAQGSSFYGLNVCSMSITSKIYFEITLGSSAAGTGKNSYCGVGSRGSANQYTSAGYFGTDSFAWSLGYSNTTAYISNNGTQTSQSGTIANGDVFMYAVDPANGLIWFGRNGTWYAGSPSAGTGASYTNLPTEVFPVVQAYDSSTHSINFGQQPFAYTPPSGFKNLNAYNLP
jgi:hypothetical protein